MNIGASHDTMDPTEERNWNKNYVRNMISQSGIESPSINQSINVTQHKQMRLMLAKAILN